MKYEFFIPKVVEKTYKNCKNVECNSLINICHKCKNKKDGCCSDKCYNRYKKWIYNKMMLNMGKRGRLEVNS